VTFDGQGNNFGRLLRFKPTVGKWREWAMPMELLAGDGSQLRGELLAMGVELDPYKARQQLPHTCKANTRSGAFIAHCKWVGAVIPLCCLMR
jgi:putative DNA primase/helicase